MSLRSIYELREQSLIRHATTAACMVVADVIQHETANTPNHRARLAWSLRSPDANAKDILPMITLNQQVQTDWAAAPDSWDGINDEVIQEFVNSWVARNVLD